MHKLARIRTNPYLHAAYKKLRGSMKEGVGALLIVGHGLGDQDAHITDLIGHARIRTVYIGAYEGLSSRDGQRAYDLRERRIAQRGADPKYPLSVVVFDSRECEIGKSPQASEIT